MKNILVLVGTGLIAFLVTFAFTTREEIGAEVENKLDSGFVEQCAAQMQFPAELEPYSGKICECMKSRFDQRGLALTDAFGDKRAEMQQITQSCAQSYM